MVLMMRYTRRILAMPHRFQARVTAVNIMLAQLAAAVGPSTGGMLLRASITGVYLVLVMSLLICRFGWA
jgi:hypothetical protein